MLIEIRERFTGHQMALGVQLIKRIYAEPYWIRIETAEEVIQAEGSAKALLRGLGLAQPSTWFIPFSDYEHDRGV